MSVNRISNVLVQMSKIEPITGAATYTGDVWIDMSNLQTGQYEIVAYIHTGVVETSVNAKLIQATDNAGSGSKDITGRAITAITASNGVAKIELRHDDGLLDDVSDPSFSFVNLEVTAVGATTAVSAEIYGGVYPFDQDSVGPQSYDQADEVVRQVIT